MTRQEILAMPAGRELNIKVAEQVIGSIFIEDEIFGDTEKRCLDFLYAIKGYCIEAPFFGPLRHYSEDMSDAEEVINKLKDYDVKFEFNHHAGKWEAEVSKLGTDFSYPVVVAATAPEAICKAALLTVLKVEE